jgi:hypothetical protein
MNVRRFLASLLLYLCLASAALPFTATPAAAYDDDRFCVPGSWWCAEARDSSGTLTGGAVSTGDPPADHHLSALFPGTTINVKVEKRAYDEGGFEYIVLETQEWTIPMGP